MLTDITKRLSVLIMIMALLAGKTASADLAIIAHPDYQGGDLDTDMVKQLFLYETTSYPSGHKATPANHAAGSPDREQFFKYVLDMGESRHKRYWSRKISSGKTPPVQLGSHEEVLEWVADTPLGISYIDANKVDDSVKILLTIAVFEDL